MSISHDLFQAMMEEVSDLEIYREIENFDTWDGLLSQMDAPGRQRPTKKELIGGWVRDRWDVLRDDLSKEAVEADGRLVVHRCIGVLDPEAFVDSLLADRKKKRGLGVYWSYSFVTAECYWGALDGTNIVITGLIDPSAIDIPATVFANFHPDFGEQEKEIRTKKGAPVFLTSVSLAEDDPRWQFDPAIPLKS
jgi:hypothetical protein